MDHFQINLIDRLSRRFVYKSAKGKSVPMNIARLLLCLALCLPSAAMAQSEDGEVIGANVEAMEAAYPKAILVQQFSTAGFPAPDPAGLTYLSSKNRLLISDSEVEELSHVPRPVTPVRNLFETTLTGSLVYSSTTLSWGVQASGEPTGIRIDEESGRVYVSDDDKKKIFVATAGPDGNIGTSDDVVSSFSTFIPPYNIVDPEDVALVTVDGQKSLIIIDGTSNLVAVVRPTNGIFGDGDDVVTHFNPLIYGIDKLEGLAVDPDTQGIMLAGRPRRTLVEVSPAGVLRRFIDIFAATPVKPSGLEWAPSSTNPANRSLYIADRGQDSNQAPTQNDGRVYELTIPPVTPGNQPPQLDAGLDQVVTVEPSALPVTVNLSAVVTDTIVPDRIRAEWEQVSGPLGITYKNDNLLQTTATLSNTGQYVLKLTVNDGELYAIDFLTITINTKPVVSAGPDLNANLNDTVTLDGLVTDDGLPNPPGVISSTWSIVSGPGIVTFANPKAQTTTATFSLPGAYILQLAASDGAVTVSDQVVVTITNGNQAPVITMGNDINIAIGGTANLAPTVTVDNLPAPSTLTYAWSSLSRPGDVTFGTPDAKDTTATFSAAGIYELQLSVSDGQLSTTATITVSVTSENNTAPTVNAGADQTIPLTGTVTLNGTASDDGIPNPTLAVTWSKVSGPGNVTFANANAAATSATFSTSGVYVLKLTAFDGEVNGSDTVTVIVNQAPTVSAGPDQTVPLTATVALNGDVSDDGVPTPPGAVTVTWSKLSGPGNVTFANANQAKTTATFSLAGAYVLQLSASDGQLSAVDTVLITVQSVGTVVNKAPIVDAGANQTIALSGVATLNGTVTDDGLPSGNLIANWTKISGPGTVTFADSDAVDTTATFSALGTYILQLTVTDEELVGSDQVTITVQDGDASSTKLFLPIVTK